MGVLEKEWGGGLKKSEKEGKECILWKRVNFDGNLGKEKMIIVTGPAAVYQ